MYDLREFRRSLSPSQLGALELFERRCGMFGDCERRQVPLLVDETRASGDPDVQFTVKGHALVFNRRSLDLGGFQEKIAPTAVDDVLDRNPDVHLVWDHDLSRPLARTLSTKYLLELRTDPRGLHFYAKVAPTSFATDLRILMEGGVVDQSSFAFTVAEDTWEIVNRDKPDEYVLRTINRIGDLFDVTITAQGAYPQTDSQVVRAYAVSYAKTNGRLDPDEPVEGTEERGADPDTAPTAPQAETPEEPSVDVPPSLDEPADAEPAEGGDPSLPSEGGVEQDPTTNPLLRATKFASRQAVEQHRFLLENSK